MDPLHKGLSKKVKCFLISYFTKHHCITSLYYEVRLLIFSFANKLKAFDETVLLIFYHCYVSGEFRQSLKGFIDYTVIIYTKIVKFKAVSRNAKIIWNCLQISLFLFSEFKKISGLLFPLKSSWSLDDFRGNRG